jgi:hypothetical protein
MSVHRSDQTDLDLILLCSFLRAGDDPVHHIMQGKTLRAAQRHRRKTQFQVTAIIFGRILHRLTSDAMSITSGDL